jgi:hypothetical protein
MRHDYGPWATLINPGRNPQLSASWRRRLGMLIPVSHACRELSRGQVLLLAAAALAMCLAPTLRGVPARAEPPKPAAEKAAAAKPEEPLNLTEEMRKQVIAWNAGETSTTLVLKDGQTGSIQVKRNLTPIAQVKVTLHLAGRGTRFDLECFDDAGKPLDGYKSTSSSVQNNQCLGLGPMFTVDGKQISPSINVKATQQGDGTVAVKATVRINPVPAMSEVEAVLKCMGKRGQVQLDFMVIGKCIGDYRSKHGIYPPTLAELGKPLPKDCYNSTGADYHYERQATRYILDSCGPDGVYETDDDEVQVYGAGGVRSGHRNAVYPLEEEKDPPLEATKPPEMPRFERMRRGDCSIRGTIVSAETGKPLAGVKMYLSYVPTYDGLIADSAADGSFEFKDLLGGPFTLQSWEVRGYQVAHYDPEGRGGPHPEFSLAENEHRVSVVIRVKPACSVSGKLRDENGQVPQHAETWTIRACFKSDDGQRYESEGAGVTGADGSYLIDGLNEKAIHWDAASQGNASPPVYYPGTSFRSDAQRVTFDKTRSVESVDITLRKPAGLALEGTVRDEAGSPVPEAFIVVHRRDVHFDVVSTYTDSQGHYRIEGLGDGQFLAHADALHRGLVRTRSPIDFAKTAAGARLDFTLVRGVAISGKLVDEKGQPWEIAESDGRALVNDAKEGTLFLMQFRNKHQPHDIKWGAPAFFAEGEGNYADSRMLFPTSSTFLVQGLLPGHTKIELLPRKDGQQVMQVLYNGRDILASGIDTQAGQELKDVAIVIGTPPAVKEKAGHWTTDKAGILRKDGEAVGVWGVEGNEIKKPRR